MQEGLAKCVVMGVAGILGMSVAVFLTVICFVSWQRFRRWF